MKIRLDQLFARPKPILGMLHLTGNSSKERLEIAQAETETLIANGVDGLIVENYFGDTDDVKRVLDWLQIRRPNVLLGLNVLRDFRLAFALERQFRIDLIQMDSVAGHLSSAEDVDFAAELESLRHQAHAALLGGVRFKYQPVKSGKTEAEDLLVGMQRCDAIVVTGAATGQETDLDKIRRFRAVIADRCPLLIGAGLTSRNARQQLAIADGAIVGSFFKDTYVDKGIVDGSHVRALMEVVEEARRQSALPKPTVEA